MYCTLVTKCLDENYRIENKAIIIEKNQDKARFRAQKLIEDIEKNEVKYKGNNGIEYPVYMIQELDCVSGEDNIITECLTFARNEIRL